MFQTSSLSRRSFPRLCGIPAAGFLLALWLSGNVNGAGPPEAFEKVVEGRGTAYAVHPTLDGGYILTGSISFVGEDDVLLLKTDALGNFLWQTSFGDPGAGGDWGTDVEVASDGGYLILGATDSLEIPPGLGGLYLIRTDSQGGLLWERTCGGMYAAEVKETGDGGYVAVGTTPGLDNGHVDSDTDWDMYLVKVGGQGNLLWSKVYGHTKEDYGASVDLTPDGGYILAGTSTFSPDTDVLIVKVDAEGAVEWERTLDLGEGEHGYGIQSSPLGGFLVAAGGYTYGPDLRVLWSHYLVRLDGGGEVLWTKTLQDLGRTDVERFLVTPDGGCVLAGGTWTSDGDSDVYLARTDPDGNLLWERTFGGSWRQFAESVEPASDGGYIIAGGGLYLVKTDEAGNTNAHRQLPGDSNGDGVLDISDGIYILRNLFFGEGNGFPCGGRLEDPSNVRLLDFNGDSGVDVSDAVGTFMHLFLGGPGHYLGSRCVSFLEGCPELCK